MYITEGIISIIFVIFLLIAKPLESLDVVSRTIVLLLAAFIALLFLTRYFRCKLTISNENICFHDGMLSRTVIPLDLVKSVEYSPKLRFTFNLKKHKKKAYINNIFDVDSQRKILEEIIRQRHNIKIFNAEYKKKESKK